MPLTPPPNQALYPCVPPRQEGRVAIVTERGAGCGGRGSVGRAMGSQGGLLSVSETWHARRRRWIRLRLSFGGLVPGPSSGFCGDGRGRSSRVVLTPRRWRQVSRRRVRLNRAGQNLHPRDDGGKRARSPGRARSKPLKPLRAGMPGDFRCLRCEDSCAFLKPFCAHEAAGALGTRHSPRPPGGRSLAHLGRIASRARGRLGAVGVMSCGAGMPATSFDICDACYDAVHNVLVQRCGKARQIY
jgi:hypothetical protein